MSFNLSDQNSLDTFWGHAESLRKTIAQSLFFILISILMALFFYQDIFHFIQKPLYTHSEINSVSFKKEKLINSSSQNKLYTLPKNSLILQQSENSIQIDRATFKLPPKAFLIIEREENLKPLALLSPIDGMTTVLKTAFFIGLFAASPAWCFLLLRFIAPALQDGIKQLLLPFLFSSFLFVLLGFSFAYFITIPLANNYLTLFNESLGTNFWTLSNYIDYTLFLALGNGLSFQSAVVALFLVHYGFLTSSQMISKRRHFIVAAFIIGALLTPPDVLTQVMLAIPLIILYECIILYAKFLERKRAKRTTNHI
ncbi:MAG TPA: twin-arginine translocase subunit TatC [Parachlamydiaceae bacterium]|nr:twin-arginine translocase subunit TatC [Parachlamydiaceae bacterium]